MTLWFRAVVDAAQARRDLRRGHSYHDTEEFSEAELADLKAQGRVVWVKSTREYDRGRKVPVVRLAGLCGFDNPATARRFTQTTAFGPYVAIYEGEFAGNIYDGDLFRPSRLVDVVHIDDFDPAKYDA